MPGINCSGQVACSAALGDFWGCPRVLWDTIFVIREYESTVAYVPHTSGVLWQALGHFDYPIPTDLRLRI